ncbi:hypothetical protein RRF57_003807 [Xylaria bambusicola]|uniref:Uncharacterized protein n=1 Tax=Xylaria bambusicola TaxID=326684 RepID=A0AAN7UMD9_9PEZI
MPMVLNVNNAIREASELPLTEGCPSHRDMIRERLEACNSVLSFEGLPVYRSTWTMSLDAVEGGGRVKSNQATSLPLETKATQIQPSSITRLECFVEGRVGVPT